MVEEPVLEEPDFAVLGRYVSKNNRFFGYSRYMNSMLDGSFEFDSVVRQPFVPNGHTDISCSETHRVGAVILWKNYRAPKRSSLFRRHIRTRLDNFALTHSWSHSGRDKVGGRYEYEVHPSTNNVVSSGLTLTRKDRVNGALTLVVRYRDQEVYRTSFRLEDCENAQLQSD